MHMRPIDTITPGQVQALVQAVDVAGSQAELARKLGVSQPTIWRWFHGHRRLPSELVIEVERLTGVSRHDLRPDIYPREIDSAMPMGIAAPSAPVACDRQHEMQRPAA